MRPVERKFGKVCEFPPPPVTEKKPRQDTGVCDRVVSGQCNGSNCCQGNCCQIRTRDETIAAHKTQILSSETLLADVLFCACQTRHVVGYAVALSKCVEGCCVYVCLFVAVFLWDTNIFMSFSNLDGVLKC